VQGTESELRKGWQCEDAVGHLDGAQRSKARGTTREPLFVLRDLRAAKAINTSSAKSSSLSKI
jgi:hypothetical protein